MTDKRLEADINDAASQAINLIEELEAEIEDLKGQLRGWQEEVDEKDSEIEELKEEIISLKCSVIPEAIKQRMAEELDTYKIC